MRTLRLAVLLALAPWGAHAAGTVTVTFIEPDHYTDAGPSRAEREQTLAAIELQMHRLGERYLATGQSIAVEVLDVDLAGQMRPVGRVPTDIRVMRGGADWPRMTLRYTLAGPGDSSVHGEETIADMAYQMQFPRHARMDPLHYEIQMLDHWFKERFGTAP